jgi:hypothetical protein
MRRCNVDWLEDMKAKSARRRPLIMQARRNITLAFEHWRAGRISTLLLFDVIDMYGTDGDAYRASRGN